jgi:hypothetical protein
MPDNCETVWDEHRRFMQHRVEQSYNELIEKAVTDSPIDFYTKVKIDDYGTVTIGEWGGYYIQIMPMIFNDRIVMTPISAPYVYDHGWCFAKGGAAILAALIWNPETEPEPLGYKKRATAGQRTAGEVVDPQISAGLQRVLARWGGELFTDSPQ